MTISPVFLLPHVRTAGGPKVILRIAQGLHNKGIDTKIIVNKYTNTHWLGSTLTVPVIESKQFSKYIIPSETTHLIVFGDGISFGPIPGNVKMIMYLQHFGVHNYDRECINMQYPYDSIITVSKWLAEIATKQFGHEKVYIIPGGIDENFKPIEIKRNKDITTIGCLYHEATFKNVGLFILAMNKLYQTNSNIQALFMGVKDPQSDKLKDLLCPYSYVKNPPQHMIPYIYGSSDIWVAPSYSEGFGLCVVEAMKCGVPTVVVKSHGLDEHLRHNENCVTINNSKMEMASAVNMLIHDTGTYKKIREGGLKLAKRFTWKNTIESFIRILESI